MAADFRWGCAVLLLCTYLICILATDGQNNKPKKKKDIRDYNDADMARLLEEWEVNNTFLIRLIAAFQLLRQLASNSAN